IAFLLAELAQDLFEFFLGLGQLGEGLVLLVRRLAVILLFQFFDGPFHLLLGPLNFIPARSFRLLRRRFVLGLLLRRLVLLLLVPIGTLLRLAGLRFALLRLPLLRFPFLGLPVLIVLRLGRLPLGRRLCVVLGLIAVLGLVVLFRLIFVFILLG